VVVVGAAGTILASTDGARWVREKSPTTADLEAVYANGHGRIFAAGAGGTILASTDGGAAWFRLRTSSTAHLRAISGSKSDDLYASASAAASSTPRATPRPGSRSTAAPPTI